MKSSAAGKNTSKRASAPDVEILSVSPHGIWLSALGQEHLLRYDDHPWFRNAPVAHIFNVQLLHGHHLHWPDCDVDLHIDSLSSPERFPLASQKAGAKPKTASRRK
jgi:hypothetical protein